jgi:hypothetical protein
MMDGEAFRGSNVGINFRRVLEYSLVVGVTVVLVAGAIAVFLLRSSDLS